MAIASSKTISIVANGQTSWIPLAPGHNRVFVKSTNWSTSSLAISLNSVDSASGAPAEITDGEPLVIATSNKVFDVDGPGYIGGVMSTYGSTAVTVEVLDKDSDIRRS